MAPTESAAPSLPSPRSPLPQPPPRHSNASSSLVPSRWQCTAGLGARGGGHGPCCQGIPPPASQSWLTAEGDTMGILVEGRAVTGPIGIHCVQGEEVLAPCPLGPVRWPRELSTGARLPLTTLELGPACSSPGSWELPSVTCPGLGRLSLSSRSARIGGGCQRWECVNPSGLSSNAHPDGPCVCVRPTADPLLTH